MKKLLSIAVLITLGVTLIPSLAGAAPNVLKGANADVDYVYMDEDSTANYTDEAQGKDNDPVEVFTDDDGDSQFLYIGGKAQFDQVYFHVKLTAEYEDNNDDLEWEYYEDGSWEDLNVSDGALDGFTKKGTYAVSFDLPDDWDKLTYQSKSAYWIRVSPEDEVERPAQVEQMSMRVYNVELNVEDEDNDEVDDLVKSDFELNYGTNNNIIGFENRDDGEYWFALAAEANDTSYKLTIDDSRYDDETITISSVDTTLDVYNVDLDDKNSSRNDDDDDDDDDDNHYVYLSSGSTPFRDLDDFSWAEGSIEDLYDRGVVSGRSYYYYYPAADVSRAEFLKMILLSAEIDVDDYDDVDEDFRDVSSSDWHYEYVQAGLDLDILDDDSYFHPDADINRAEAVTMLVRLEDELNDVNLSDTYTSFWDVNRYDWFAKYISFAYDNNIVEGYGDGYFRPDEDLSRAEAAVLADRAYDQLWD
jgi:hypothetical protein